MNPALTMKALVFHGPYDVRLEERPIPKICEPTDVIIKTTVAALCGSELHAYRGHANSTLGYICGHEGAGTIVAVGPDVLKFKPGDSVIVPFTTACGDCYFCQRSFSSRCSNVQLFGSPQLDGSQAEFFRVPLADSTCVVAPPELGDELILMADIYPTGFYGARNAFSASPKERWSEMVVVVIGCGPVALCSMVAALNNRPACLYAVDSVPERLARAKKIGAIPLNFKSTDVKAEIMKITNGRGADAVIEVVGHPDALRTAFDIVRASGMVSVLGLHTDKLPFDGKEAYSKNLHIQFGRCPVRSIFQDALDSLIVNRHKFKDFIDVVISTLSDDSIEALKRFEKNEVFKVVLKPNEL